MNEHDNAVSWFEIPVQDMERARTFYAAILGKPTQDVLDKGAVKMSILPLGNDKGQVGGALTHSQGSKPSMSGTLVYLNASPNIQEFIDRVQPAGGRVLVQRTDIGEDMGFFSIFSDSEGNQVALHAFN